MLTSKSINGEFYERVTEWTRNRLYVIVEIVNGVAIEMDHMVRLIAK